MDELSWGVCAMRTILAAVRSNVFGGQNCFHLQSQAVTSSHLHGVTIASSYTHQDRNAGIQIVYDAIYQLVSIAEQ